MNPFGQALVPLRIKALDRINTKRKFKIQLLIFLFGYKTMKIAAILK